MASGSSVAARRNMFNQPAEAPKTAAKPAPKPKPPVPAPGVTPVKIRNDSKSVLNRATVFDNRDSIHPPAKTNKPSVVPRKPPIAKPNPTVTAAVNGSAAKINASKPSFLHQNNVSNAKSDTKSVTAPPVLKKNDSEANVNKPPWAQSLKPPGRPSPGYTEVNKGSSGPGGFKIADSTDKNKPKQDSAPKPKEAITKKGDTTNVISVGSRTYKQLPLKSVYGSPPKKPNRPPDVTVGILQDIKKNVGGGDDDFEEEDYDDIATIMTGSPLIRKGTDKEKRVTAVSLIEEWTEEEEERLIAGKAVKPEDDDQEVYDDVAGVAPGGDDQEEYDDIQNLAANSTGNDDFEEEVYETFDDDVDSPTGGSGQNIEDAETKKKKVPTATLR